MFMDFVTLAMDQLVNQAAKIRFMSGGQVSVPMVLRTPHGGTQNAGPQHSQCLEAWLAHVPGLIVICPATPADTYGLLRARSEEHTSELQSLMRISYDVFCLKKNTQRTETRIV